MSVVVEGRNREEIGTALQFTAVQGLAGPQGRESVVQPMESTVNLTPLSTVSLALAAFL